MTYTDELLEILRNYMEATLTECGQESMRRSVPLVEGSESNADFGKLARDLHTELYRRSGMTADEIIAEWNRRSPEDTW